MTSSVHPATDRERLAQAMPALRAQLIEQRGFRIDQLRMLCRAPMRSSRSAREITVTLKSGARSALRDVEAALARMDEGSYGLCVACGADLPLARLEVLPSVPMCLHCQRARELAS